jgi:hypothetical protein
MAQQVMIVSTTRPDLRDEIFGWTVEDPNLFVPGKPIGYTPHARDLSRPGTVMEALAFGWRLLAPPTEDKDLEGWTWWLVRDA